MSELILPVKVGKATDVGHVRELNEDCATVAAVWPSSLNSATPVVVTAVADGMGGHASGEVASRLAIDSFIRTALADLSSSGGTDEDLVRAMDRAFQKANTEVYRNGPSRADSLQSRPGTTLTAVILRDLHLVLGHVGDSRAYLLRRQRQRAQQLTRDHVSPSGGLLQALGIRATVVSDILTEELCEGDTLVLCTDGLYHSHSEGELAKAAVRCRDPQALCDNLVGQALARDGKDNITAVCLKVEESSGKGPGTLERLRQTFASFRQWRVNRHGPGPSRALLTRMLAAVLVMITVVVGQIWKEGRPHPLHQKPGSGHENGRRAGAVTKAPILLSLSLTVERDKVSIKGKGSVPFTVAVGDQAPRGARKNIDDSFQLRDDDPAAPSQKVELTLTAASKQVLMWSLKRRTLTDSVKGMPLNAWVWADGHKHDEAPYRKEGSWAERNSTGNLVNQPASLTFYLMARRPLPIAIQLLSSDRGAPGLTKGRAGKQGNREGGVHHNP